MDVKISPDGKFAAFGVQGGNSNVEIVSISGTFHLKHHASVNVEMQQGLMHLDWSKDSQVLIVNSQYQEVKYVSVKDLAPMPAQ